VRVSDDFDRGELDISATGRVRRELDAVGVCVSLRVFTRVLPEDCALRLDARAGRRDESFSVLYRLISTDGNDRTPTSSESEWPSAERKERCGRTVRRNDVRRLVSRWRQRKRIGETASEIASSVIVVTTLLLGRVSLTQRSRSGMSRRNHRWRWKQE
jgi:hypothetical protein